MGTHLPLMLLFAAALITLFFVPVSSIIVEDFAALPQTSYDFVIVGGGTAGSVLANRLTENPRFNVLVIEAGPSNEGVLNSMVPGFSFALQGSAYDWNFTSTPQIGLNNRTDRLPRGHLLGGSSSINGLFYTRGSSDDYNRWASVTGDPGWSWDNLLPYIFKTEKWSIPSDHHNTTGQYDPEFHSVKGMTQVSLTGVPQAADMKILEASEELGGEFAFDLDMNDGTPLGIGWLQSTIGNGTRSSAAAAYLGSSYIGRENLHVVVNHRVIRILETALGPGQPAPAFRTVAFMKGRNPASVIHHVTATKEVLVCAGTYETPKLLMLSGIGEPSELESVGIRPIVDLPSVGKNLTEHPQIVISWNLSIQETSDPYANATFLEDSLAEWFSDRTGFLTSLGVNFLGWFRIPDDWPFWDRFEDPSAGPTSPHLELVIVGGGMYPLPAPFLSVNPALSSPHSRGALKLNSSHPFDYPLIDLGLLTSEYDVVALREGVRGAQKFLTASTWAEYNLTLVGPLAGVTTNEELDQFIRNSVIAGAHPVGTAAMSPANATYGVVDPDLKVKKVSGLRVVDASIMPYLVTGHTQAAVYAISERAADIIKSSWPDAV